MSADAERPRSNSTAFASLIASATALGLCAAGQLHVVFGTIALLVGMTLVPWTVVVFVRLLVAIFRRGPVLQLLASLGLSVAAFVLMSLDVYGVPLWIRWQAAPLQGQLEDWKRAHGAYPEVSSIDPSFPPEVKGPLHEAGCLYGPKDEGYGLTCRSVVFTKCSYDKKENSWSSWD